MDPRRRQSGYPTHGSGQSPAPGAQNYETPIHGNEARYPGPLPGNAGLGGHPNSFFAPQGAPPSQPRPITLKELEQMALAQSVSSQFAGNSLFGGGGDFVPPQGGLQPSLFGDSFFQGTVAAAAGVHGGMPEMGVNGVNGVNGVHRVNGAIKVDGVSGMDGRPSPGRYMPSGPPPNQQVVDQQRQAMQLEQLNELFRQQTVGGANPASPGAFAAPSTINNAVLPPNLPMSPMLNMSNMSPGSLVSPNQGLASPLAAVSTPQRLDTRLEGPSATTGSMSAKQGDSASTSTSTPTQQYQKQSREDRWVDIMDHTHTGRKPVTDMTALNKSLLALAKSLSHNEDDVKAWKQALSYVQGILTTTLGSSLKDVSLFGSSANGLAVHGNNDIDVSAMVDLGDGGLLLGDVTMLSEEEIEAREAVIRQKKGDIIAELGLALERDLDARFGDFAGEAAGKPRAVDGHAEVRETGAGREPKFNLLVLPNARVPVIKFTYPPTQTQVDITINNTLACLNTKLIACYAAIDERVGQLVHIVKHWAKRRHVNDPYTGTLSSYCYVLMCIFHCQTRNPPILPNLQDDLVYPMTIDTVVDSWKVAYLDDVTVAKQAFKTQNTQTLASLVWEFFEFWAWKHSYPHDVISIRKGRIVSKASKDWTKRIGRDRHLVCVEDPFVVSHDLGRTVDMRSKDVIRKEFFRAATVLRDYDDCFELLFEGYSCRPSRQRTPVSSSKRGGRGQARRTSNQTRGR